jgi:hypothetical protein
MGTVGEAAVAAVGEGNAAITIADGARGMMRFVVVLLTLFATPVVTGCKDRPAADGRYATYDHGNYRPP